MNVLVLTLAVALCIIPAEGAMKINPAVEREIGTYPAPSSAEFICPEGCDCLAEDFDDIRQGCNVELRCTKVPSSYPPELDCLTLNDGAIADYTTEAKQVVLDSIPSSELVHLDLGFCGFGAGSAFPRGAPFRRFQKLRFLNLEFNRITDLEETTFQGLSQLRTLWLTVCGFMLFWISTLQRASPHDSHFLAIRSGQPLQ